MARLIIDAVVAHISHATPLRTDFWWLVGLEFGLACLTSVLNRIVDYCDTLLADKFIRHISVRIMHHASRLDLASYEDPLFHDKLERARVQATDRLGMVQQLGGWSSKSSPLSRWPPASCCFLPGCCLC